MKREANRLFGPGSGFCGFNPEPSEAEKLESKRKSLLALAATFRDFAANGYRVRYHTKHAERLEAEARDLHPLA